MAEYITDAELKTALAPVLRKASVHDLNPLWDGIVPDANEAAYNEIIGRLTNRGYSVAQIDQWARRYEFNRDIGLFWCLVKGAGLDGYDDKWIDRLDRREELDEVTIVIDDEVADIADTTAAIGHGPLSTTDDIFVLTTEGRGQTTNW